MLLGPEAGPVAGSPAGRRLGFWGGHLIRLHRCSSILIQRVGFRNTNDGVALTRCNGTEIADCTAFNTVNVAFDHWFGGSRHIVRRCAIDTCGSGVMVTGMGTDGQDGHQTDSLVDSVRVKGATGSAIIANCLSAGSTVDGIRVTNCEIDGGGVKVDVRAGIYATGIVGHGDVRRAQVVGNRFIGVNGLPIVFQAEGYGKPERPGQSPSDCVFDRNVFENCRPTTAAGGPAPLMVIRGKHHTIRNNRATGGEYAYVAETDDASDRIERNEIPAGRMGRYQTNRTSPLIIGP
jgi:hypothetical protein